MTNRTVQRKKQARQVKGSSKRRPTSRRGRSPSIGTIAILSVAAIVVAMVVIRATRQTKAPVEPRGTAATDVIDSVTSVPAAVLDAVGGGSGVTPPDALPSRTPALTIDGKPEILYVGAEYCPYCAAQRWPLIVALSRFGRFSGLSLTTSSAADVFPSTPTFTFHGSTYTSDALVFTSVETETNTQRPLETLTLEQQRLMKTFNPSGGIPFLLIGNAYVQSGTSVDPGPIDSMTWQQIEEALSDPKSEVARQILGATNMMTAAICAVTNGQPSDVCTAPGVTAAAGSLPAS